VGTVSDPTVQVVPPMDFAARVNAAESRRGKPYLSALDPLMLLLWHQAAQPPPQGSWLITGV
jgi:hypothetical protein